MSGARRQRQAVLPLLLWILHLLLTTSSKSSNLTDNIHIFEARYTDSTSAIATAYADLPVYDNERLLAEQELHRTQVLQKTFHHRNQELYGFYHVNMDGNAWKLVLTEQMLLLDGRRRFPPVNSRNKTSTRDKSYANMSIYEWDMTRKYTSLLEMSVGLYVVIAVPDVESFGVVKTFILSLPITHKDKLIFECSKALPIGTHRDAGDAGRPELEQDPLHSEGEGASYVRLHQFCTNYTSVSDWHTYGHSIPDITPFENDELMHKYQTNIFYDKFRDYQQYQQSQGASSTGHGKKGGVSSSSGTSSASSKSSNNPSKHKRALVYYVYTRDTKDETGDVATWRDYLNAVLLEFPSICMRAIGLRKYSVCGTQRKQEFYGGNFWYSDCEHIAQLPPLNRFDWFGAEYFILKSHHFGEGRVQFAYDCAYSFLHYDADMQIENIQRFDYLEQLWRTCTAKSMTYLPPSNPEYVYHEIPGMKRFCALIKKPSHYHELIAQTPFVKEFLERLNIPADGKPIPRRKSYSDLNEITWHFTLNKVIPKIANSKAANG